MFGIEIIFINGEKDWIDPCEDEPEQEGSSLFVSNITDTYTYDSAELDRWFKYDLCKYCDHDLRTYGCNEDNCLKP